MIRIYRQYRPRIETDDESEHPPEPRRENLEHRSTLEQLSTTEDTNHQ